MRSLLAQEATTPRPDVGGVCEMSCAVCKSSMASMAVGPNGEIRGEEPTPWREKLVACGTFGSRFLRKIGRSFVLSLQMRVPGYWVKIGRTWSARL